MADEIDKYCDAKEEQEQANGGDGSGFIGAVDKRPRESGQPRLSDSKGKDKGKGKGGKTQKGKSKDHAPKGGRGKHGRGKGGKDYKGKDHKGMGKDPSRSEAVRFGGKCNRCWRIGHKEA